MVFAAIGLSGFGACVVLAILGLVRGIANWGENPPSTLSIVGLISGIVFTAGAIMMTVVGALVAWAATVGFSRGRPTRETVKYARTGLRIHADAGRDPCSRTPLARDVI
jgi:hypothetical protein